LPRCRSLTPSFWRPTPSGPGTRCGRCGATATLPRSPRDARDDEVVRFLAARSHAALPDIVTTFFQDTAGARKLRDLGLARVIECQDAALAALIAGDRRLSKLAWRCGERHLIVPATAEAEFRKGLHHLGYALPSADR
jgi:hypothetical protein